MNVMNTRLKTLLPVLLAAALTGPQAAAIEEVVVIGTDTSVSAHTVAAPIDAEMSKYVRQINAAQKLKLDAELAKLSERRIQIAAATLPTRG